MHCGGILNFLDEYIIYGVIFLKGDTIITLLNNDINHIIKRITNENEWVLV